MVVSTVEIEKGNLGSSGDLDHKAVNKIKSAWNIPVDGKVTDVPVMGADSWPALAEPRLPKKSDSAATKAVVTPQSPAPVQGSAEHQSCNGIGSTDTSSKNQPHHNQRTSTKRNHPPFGVPPIPIPAPYQQQAITPIFRPTTPYLPSPIHYPPYPAPLQSYAIPPRPGGRVDSNRNRRFQPLPQGDFNVNANNIAHRQHNLQEPGARLNNPLRPQQPFTPRGGISNQQSIGPRSFLRPRPPIPPPPGVINGPIIPVPPSMFYLPPAAPLDAVTSPYLNPPPSHSGFHMPTADTLTLKGKLVKQIEYYFSDVNLQNDHHLKSLMDDQGWVSIHKIADFNMVKRMNVDIPFILDALWSSSSIDQLGGKIRRRDNWSKWLLATVQHACASEPQTPQGQIDEKGANVAVESSEPNEGGKVTSSEWFTGLPSNTENMEESLPSNKETLRVANRNNINEKLKLDDKDSSEGHAMKSTGTNCSTNSGCLQGVSEPTSCGELENPILSVLILQNRSPLSDDVASEASGAIGEHRILLLDEDQTTIRKDHLSSIKSSMSLLSSSPQEVPSKSSPPMGSLLKPFSSWQHPTHHLLEENGLQQERYQKFYECCLSSRRRLGIGRNEEMNDLYNFWSFYLRSKFDASIYNDFRRLACEDAAANCNCGLEYLFQFYSYMLELEFREDLYKDFELITLEFYNKGNLYGLEKYWAFHQYREGQNKEAPLKKHPELDRLLREEYCSLADFHTNQS